MTRQNKKMPLKVSVRVRSLHQDKGVKICDLVKRFPNYSKSNIYIQAKLQDEAAKTDGRKLNEERVANNGGNSGVANNGDNTNVLLQLAGPTIKMIQNLPLPLVRSSLMAAAKATVSTLFLLKGVSEYTTDGQT